MSKTAEEQRQRQLPYAEFDLIKFKVTEGGKGVNVSHHESGSDAGEIDKKGEVAPHPDLQAVLDELKPYVALRLGILDGWNFAREELRGDLDKLAHAKKSHDEYQDSVRINGLSYQGDGEKAGVIISGYLKLPKGGGFGFAIPKISFLSDTLGYEAEIEEICERAKVEVYGYRFQSKKLQLDIETEAKKNEDPTLFNEPKPEEKKVRKNAKNQKPNAKDILKGDTSNLGEEAPHEEVEETPLPE